MKRFLAAIILFVSCSFLVGCGTGNVPVEGRVMLDDKPLSTGYVAFHPEGTAGESETVIGRGEIDAEGTYRLTTDGQPGIAAGKYQVVVIASAPSNPEDPYSVPMPLVDPKFTQLSTTPLLVEVASSNGPEKYLLTVSK